MKDEGPLRKSWDLPGGGMGKLKVRLEAGGLRIDGFTPAAPVQVWGWLPSGEPFYFRERHGTASFEIHGDGDLDELVGRQEEARWCGEVELQDQPDESVLSIDALVLEFLRRYREDT